MFKNFLKNVKVRFDGWDKPVGRAASEFSSQKVKHSSPISFVDKDKLPHIGSIRSITDKKKRIIPVPVSAPPPRPSVKVNSISIFSIDEPINLSENEEGVSKQKQWSVPQMQNQDISESVDRVSMNPETDNNSNSGDSSDTGTQKNSGNNQSVDNLNMDRSGDTHSNSNLDDKGDSVSTHASDTNSNVNNQEIDLKIGSDVENDGLVDSATLAADEDDLVLGTSKQSSSSNKQSLTDKVPASISDEREVRKGNNELTVTDLADGNDPVGNVEGDSAGTRKTLIDGCIVPSVLQSSNNMSGNQQVDDVTIAAEQNDVSDGVARSGCPTKSGNKVKGEIALKVAQGLNIFFLVSLVVLYTCEIFELATYWSSLSFLIIFINPYVILGCMAVSLILNICIFVLAYRKMQGSNEVKTADLLVRGFITVLLVIMILVYVAELFEFTFQWPVLSLLNVLINPQVFLICMASLLVLSGLVFIIAYKQSSNVLQSDAGMDKKDEFKQDVNVQVFGDKSSLTLQQQQKSRVNESELLHGIDVDRESNYK